MFDPHNFKILVKKINRYFFLWGWFCSMCDISWKGSAILPQNRYKPSEDLLKATLYIQENHIGSAVNDILCYKQTNSRVILLLLYKKKIICCKRIPFHLPSWYLWCLGWWNSWNCQYAASPSLSPKIVFLLLWIRIIWIHCR